MATRTNKITTTVSCPDIAYSDPYLRLNAEYLKRSLSQEPYISSFKYIKIRLILDLSPTKKKPAISKMTGPSDFAVEQPVLKT
tara:strand:+ start:349 stop:597 length:249 start_codon:yes stop_codon:yes gene_type:complete